MATQADGYAEREVALLMLEDNQSARKRRIPVGADKAFAGGDFVDAARKLNVTYAGYPFIAEVGAIMLLQAACASHRGNRARLDFRRVPRSRHRLAHKLRIQLSRRDPIFYNQVARTMLHIRERRQRNAGRSSIVVAISSVIEFAAVMQK